MTNYAMDNTCWGASVAPSPDYVAAVGAAYLQGAK
jgi:hypothetical protein